jgi:hypothetical protein
MQTDQDDDRRCFIDGGDGSEGCVLDENDLDGCDMAANLHADSRCKTDCPHWRYPDAVAESRKSDARRVEVHTLIRADAAKTREEKLQRDMQDVLDMAASGPNHQESSGQGCYCPPERKSDSEQFTH